jgi:hypothetical protein
MVKNEGTLSTSRLIIVQHEIFKILYFSTGWIGLSQKTISRFCPFKSPDSEIFLPCDAFQYPNYEQLA